MTLGRKNGKMKIKTDGNAGLRAVSCGCCAPLPTPCNLFPASDYQRYFDDPNNLPSEIYIGGTRQFITRNLIPPWGSSYETLTFWAGITGGTLLTRAGTSYGDTINGMILETQNGNYIWAVYKNGVKLTASFLLDGINRHDNFPTAYQVDIVSDAFADYFPPLNSGSSFTIYRYSCESWRTLYGSASEGNPSCNGPCGDTSFSEFYLSGGFADGGSSHPPCQPYSVYYPEGEFEEGSPAFYQWGCALGLYSLEKMQKNGNGLAGDWSVNDGQSPMQIVAVIS